MQPVFWNVDTQKDFMHNTGALYVPGAEAIIPNLARITQLAEKYRVRVVNTADLHDQDSLEISPVPDWKVTYPAHCMEGTRGQELVPETAPKDAYPLSWKDKGFDPVQVLDHRNLVLYKDGTDIFQAPHTRKVIDIINPGTAIVYGVVTNICVDKAVRGLCREGINVYVVKDATKELPGCDLDALYKGWQSCCNRVRFVTTDGLEALLTRR